MPVQPRKTFAPSFVLTVVGSVAVAGAAPETKPTPPISKNPPAPPTRKPPPSKPPKNPKAPTVDRHYHYMKMGEKCVAHDMDVCKVPAGQPAPPCNPPPPTAINCPENLTLPQKVTQKAGSLDCWVDWGPMTCPKDAKCNPPAPRRVACPNERPVD